jgi:hypothetical protein
MKPKCFNDHIFDSQSGQFGTDNKYQTISGSGAPFVNTGMSYPGFKSCFEGKFTNLIKKEKTPIINQVFEFEREKTKSSMLRQKLMRSNEHLSKMRQR